MRVSPYFYHRIPKEIHANLRWRAAVHKRVAEDPEFAQAMIQACAKDPLFFINGWAWTYDPRPEIGGVRRPFAKLPFILYPFQEDAIKSLCRALGGEDILVEKSRDMGASWLCVISVFWAWRFRTGLSFLLGSRVEGYVDDPGNPKSMFWKIDYLLNNMPSWLRPAGYNPGEHRRKLHIENPENGSVIDGESTNANFARGDRRTAIVLDEFAAVEAGHRILNATRDATACRIFNSTPAGTNNAFYAIRETGIKKLRLHWSIHPLKSVGLYTTDEHGKLKVLDPKGYPKKGDGEPFVPILDGKLRSPWYDNECKRAANTQEIAQELDIDYLGSSFQYFNSDLVHQRIREHARPPILVGDLEYDEETAEPIGFRENPEGNLKLWFLLDRNNDPPKDHKYSLGIDVSAGTGASNSAAAGWDITTHEKVVEYVNPFIRPESLAKQVIAIARWLGNAYVIWESGGPGRQFGSRVNDLQYRNVYLRRRDEAISGKVSDIPGVAQTKETKNLILGAYRAAIEKGYAVNRSKEALEETLEYIFDNANGVTHSRATDKADPSGAKSNHGDRAMADALAWKGIMDRTTNPKESEKPDIPIGSLAWRNKMRAKKKRLGSRELDHSWN